MGHSPNYSFITIDNKDTIKWNLKNVRKWLVIAQTVTYNHVSFVQSTLAKKTCDAAELLMQSLNLKPPSIIMLLRIPKLCHSWL